MNMRRLLLITLVALESTWAVRAWGYESDIHQQLTFIAARQFNQCAQQALHIDRLSALDTRYIVKANAAQADGNFFGRMFRWAYYNRADQTNRSSWGIIDTRFHDQFNQLSTDVEMGKKRRRQLTALGQLLSYIQKVSSPPHAVPVYMGRWWRFSLSDRFNRYPVDAERVERAVASSCRYLRTPAESYQQILVETANDTITAVQGQIFGYPATWESFWQLADDADEFGEYGRAGNTFGERTSFRCGDRQRCLLLEDDPLYADFAADRHIAAVLATMRALVLLQHKQPRAPQAQ
jgi:hypothetical protein